MSTATLERIMGHYKSNVRDLEFVLFEVLGVDKTLGSGAFADMDLGSAREVLAEVDRLATGVVADSFVDSDRNPPVFDPEAGSVTLPASFKASYEAIVEGEWWRLWLPPHLGGLGAPPSLTWAANELLLGSNPGAFMYLAGFQFASILDGIASEDQKRWPELMVEKQWGSTMVLTEPDAGSDVGAGRTRAIEQADGTWHIEGVKRFITSGDSDLSENIVHLVLARPEGAGPGTKGLSLFVVPKFLVTDMETGALGERNGVYVTNVEKKMGLKVSATCEMTFGEHQPAVGYLVGGVHDGIRQMFKVIENARMFVGTKAIATLSTGYLNALDFAKNRVQSADLTRAADKTAPRVTILHHPDVRRLLLLQKSYAEGMRALMLYAATYQDKVAAALAEGTTDEDAERMNDLLLPLVKGVGSERSYELLAQALQIFGGSGYLQDYPIEQYLRDSKIDTLYEGTTAIQGQDLFFRKIVKDQGRSLAVIANDIQAFAKGDAGNGSLARERALLGEALENVQGMLGTMVGYLTSAAEDVRQIYRVGLTSTTLLMSLGDLVIGWLLLREADVALGALSAGPSARDTAFYEGKVASGQWFARNVLPELAARRTVTEGADLDIMDLAEEAF